MTRSLRAGMLTLVGLLLAGCGHGSMHALPPASSAARSPQYLAPSTPVLYVASQDRVEAYAITARGSTPPDRTIFVHANQVARNVSITSFVDGTLDVAQTYYPSSGPNPKCRVVVKSATADGNDASLTPTWDCSAYGDAAAAFGVATNFGNGGIDVLFEDLCGCDYSTLDRVTQGWGNGNLGTAAVTLSMIDLETNLATDVKGNDFVNNGTTTITEYTPDQNDYTCPGGPPCFPDNIFQVATKNGTPTTFLGAMAVSPADGTIYAIGKNGSGGFHLLGYTHFADHFCFFCSTVSATYDKTFVNGTNVTAVAVGSDGTVYVGMTTSLGPRVKIFTPHPDDGSNPNAVGNLTALAGDGPTIIASMNVYQP